MGMPGFDGKIPYRPCQVERVGVLLKTFDNQILAKTSTAKLKNAFVPQFAPALA